MGVEVEVVETTGPVRATDVARAAGVSTATVSLVVNDKADGRIAPETQDRVRRAVARLGYRVDRRASGLAGGRAGVVSLLVPDLDSPFFAHVTMTVHDALGGDLDLRLELTSHDDQRVGRSLDRVLASRIDGLLLDGVGARFLPERQDDLPFPVVVMDDPDDRVSVPSVDFDLAPGARALARHLVEQGHARLAYLAPTVDTPTFRRRRRHLAAGLADASAWRAELVELASGTTADAARTTVVEQLDLLGREVTALVCATDVQAYGALQALLEHGVAVPGDLSLASFDDLPMARVVTPSLTAVCLPADQLATAASESLLRAIRTGEPPARQPVVPTRLVVRDSTGPART